MIRDLQPQAQKRGVTDIALETLEWNKRAVALYTGLGFSITQTTDSFRLFLKEESR